MGLADTTAKEINGQVRKNERTYTSRGLTFSIRPVDADWPERRGASTVLIGIPDKSDLKAMAI